MLFPIAVHCQGSSSYYSFTSELTYYPPGKKNPKKKKRQVINKAIYDIKSYEKN